MNNCVFMKSRILFNVFLLVFAVCVITSCESFIRGKEYIIPGDRVDIIPGVNMPLPDRNNILSIKLGPSFSNRIWKSGGANNQNNIGNLSYSGNFLTNWEFDIGSGKEDSYKLMITPISVDQTIYTVDSNNHISAIDERTGNLLWSKNFYPETENPREGFGGGLLAESGMIFFANGFGEVYALDSQNGDILWKYDIGIPIRSSPIGANGYIYVLTVDNVVQSFDAVSGEKIWSHEWFVESAGFIQSSSMALNRDLLIVPYRSGEIFAFNPRTGRRLWGDSVNRKNITASLSQIKDIVARPLIHNDIIVSVGYQGRLIANKASNGFRIWEQPISSNLTPIAVDEYLFLTSKDNIFYILDHLSGDIIWYKDLKQIIPKDEEIKFIGQLMVKGMIYLFTKDGDLLIIDLKDSISFSYEPDLISDLSISPIIVNQRLYIVTENGLLISYK